MTVLDSIIDAATAPFAATGRYAYHFARGKLRHDPAFAFLLRAGVLPARGRLIDLGCGLGVLPALIDAARQAHAQGRWIVGWAEPPCDLALAGVELLDWKVNAGRAALFGKADIRQGDIRTCELGVCDAIVILDVLLYLDDAEQRAVLKRVRDALAPGGVFVLREANAGGGLRFHVTRLAEQACCLARGQGWARLTYRPARQWQALLEDLGFTVAAHPMSAGTPFDNVLFVARWPS